MGVQDLKQKQNQLERERNLLELKPPVPVGPGNSAVLSSDICQRFERSYRRDAKELTGILKDTSFKALLTAHDSIAGQYLEGGKLKSDEPSPWDEISSPDKDHEKNKDRDRERGVTFDLLEDYATGKGPIIYGQPIRVIGLRKIPGQPLGVTVEDIGGSLVVARILNGGMIDRMGLLQVGDVILEVNSKEVNTPQELLKEIEKSRADSLQLKVASSVEDKFGYGLGYGQCFLRAFFSYDPALDSLLPCKDIGLKFEVGEILHIVDQSDPNWWQAKKIDEKVVGLIPSRELEERRAAFVRPEADYVHSTGVCGTKFLRRKKRCVYTAKQNSDFDRAELVLYEEVTRLPPFPRKTLLLVGTSGVGRRTLKNKLISSDPRRFASVIPITSRPPLQGEERLNKYVFISREEFQEGILANRFLEFKENEKDGYFTGTSFDAIRDVIRHGKLCVIDCGPSILKLLHNSAEFMPYVVFVGARGANSDNYNPPQYQHQSLQRNRTLELDRSSRKHGTGTGTGTGTSRFGSRRARTMESISTLVKEDDQRHSIEESQRIQHSFSQFFDLLVVNEDESETFRRVSQAVDSLSTDHQWVPIDWIY